MQESLVPMLDLATKDFLLGFFMALALRRGRIKELLDKILPESQGDES
ncbi:hypothetical protein [Halosegnis longus]|nr:hypothetical protein [Halosegnis longus]